MADTVTLYAADLLRKYGFDDGNLLDDILDDAGYVTNADLVDEDEDIITPGFSGGVLAECVRRFLEPQLEGLRLVYDYSASHNPVRLADWDKPSPEARAILHGKAVQVLVPDVLRVAAEMAPRYVDAGGPEAASTSGPR